MKVYVGVDENGEEDVKDEEGLGRISEDQVEGKVADTSDGDGKNVKEVQGDKGEDDDKGEDFDKGEDGDTEKKSEGGDEGDKRDKEDDGEQNKEEHVDETKKAGDTENKSEGGDEGDERDKEDDGEQNKEEHVDETKKAGDVGVNENGVVGNTRNSEESMEEKDKDGKPLDTEGSVTIEGNKTVESGTQQAGDSVDGANKAKENTASEKEDVVEVVEKGESIEETNGNVVNDVDHEKSLLEGKTSEETLTEGKDGEVRF